MYARIPRSALYLLLVGLLLANIAVYVYVFTRTETSMLTVAFLDVGQGDAIFIEGPTGTQVLIDGGKDRSVLRELPRVIGPLDRTIDMVVATHPDADHVGGLPGVLSRYRVEHILISGREADTSYAEGFTYAAQKEGVPITEARSGMRVHIGGGVYADVLHPEYTVDRLRESNDASIVMRLVYGETEFMFTGDSPEWVEERILSRYDASELESDVLQAGHHGSRTSSGSVWLEAVSPETVAISAGKDNAYGHPHEDVLGRISEIGARVRATLGEGAIIFESDGVVVKER